MSFSLRATSWIHKALSATALSSCLLTGALRVDAAAFYFDAVGGNSVLDGGATNWSLAEAHWLLSGNAIGTPLSAWTNGSDAIFETGGSNVLTVTEDLIVKTIQQGLAGTSSTINSSTGNTITLTGNASAVTNQGDQDLSFGAGVGIVLAAENTTATQDWSVVSDRSIVVNSNLSGVAGSVNTGGLNKTGLGTLVLGGANTYSGYTHLSQGMVRANSATAFGSSAILFQGGTLQYGTGITQDFSSQFSAASSTGPYSIDTNGNHVVFATALSGNQGFVKKGAGILSLAGNSSFTGTVVVEEGVLRSNAPLLASNAFGGAGNLIDIRDGATVDIRWITNGLASPDTLTSVTSVKYNLTAVGKGVVDTSGLIFGGYVGAVTTSGGLSSTENPFTTITLTGATTFSGGSKLSIDSTTGTGRYGITNINANGHDITFVNARGISWRGSSSSNIMNVKNIYVEQGHIYADGNFFGDVAGGVMYLNANTLGATTVRGELRNYVSTKTVAKDIRLNGGNIQFEGVPGTLDTAQTWTFSGTLTLATNSLSRNTINSAHFNRDIKLSGRVTGSNGFDYTGSTTGTGVNRYTVLTIANGANDFTGSIRHHRAIIRMSDGVNHGTLGNTSNEVNLTTAGNITILDLFGTSQGIGALNSAVTSGVNQHFIQNNRTNTTSILTVGNGNASGDFYGVMRNYGTLLAGNASAGNATYTGDGAAGALFGFRKVGTGTQTLRGASVYTGDTVVDAGTLLVRNTPATGTSATGLGNFTANGTSVVGGTGSITGADAKSITLGAGTFLMVGNTRKVSAGGGGAASELLLGSNSSVQINLGGKLEIDLFGNAASLTSTEADRLKLVSNNLVTLGGILEVFDTTATSNTWTVGSSWQIIDWTGVVNKTGTFSSFILPTLQTNHTWDTSSLYTLGVISIVPEPSRMLLTVGGLIYLLTRRRRILV